jgi:hypothetical protein
MYRSSYGPTIDGLQKPEVIAPGIWVAAPILPHTPTAEEAELYSRLDAASDEELPALLAQYRGVDKDLDQASDLRVPLLRQLITIKLREGNVINEHYKYVDGTSFAAPIVSSIVACMLEANPRLTPQQIKRILISTAYTTLKWIGKAGAWLITQSSEWRSDVIDWSASVSRREQPRRLRSSRDVCVTSLLTRASALCKNSFHPDREIIDLWLSCSSDGESKHGRDNLPGG